MLVVYRFFVSLEASAIKVMASPRNKWILTSLTSWTMVWLESACLVRFRDRLALLTSKLSPHRFVQCGTSNNNCFYRGTPIILLLETKDFYNGGNKRDLIVRFFTTEPLLWLLTRDQQQYSTSAIRWSKVGVNNLIVRNVQLQIFIVLFKWQQRETFIRTLNLSGDSTVPF